jgi:hypothetical protein
MYEVLSYITYHIVLLTSLDNWSKMLLQIYQFVMVLNYSKGYALQGW